MSGDGKVREVPREVRVDSLPIGGEFISKAVPGWGGRDTRGKLIHIGVGSVLVMVGTQGTGSYYEDSEGNRIEFDTGGNQVRWAPDAMVVPVAGSGPNLENETESEDSIMTATSSKKSKTHTSGTKVNPATLRARYKFQQSALEKATAANDEAKATEAMTKMEAIEQEAAAAGVALVEEQEAQATSAGQTGTVAGKATKAPKAPKEPKAKREPKVKEMAPCLDGCGTMVGGNFATGHDARLKSLLIQVERGEKPASAIPKVVQDLVKLVKGPSKEQPFVIRQAPVRFPGRDDIKVVNRDGSVRA